MTALEVFVNKKPHRLKILERNKNIFLIEVNEKITKVNIKNPSQGKAAILEINGRSLQARIHRKQRNSFQVEINGKTFDVQRQPRTLDISPVERKRVTANSIKPAAWTAKKNIVAAPIAGRIVLLKTEVGQKVEKGECMFVLEAMKMENEIAAPKAGAVKEIRISEGAIVKKWDVLAVID